MQQLSFFKINNEFKEKNVKHKYFFMDNKRPRWLYE